MYTLIIKYDIQKAQNSFSQSQPNFSLTCHFHDCQPHKQRPGDIYWRWLSGKRAE